MNTFKMLLKLNIFVSFSYVLVNTVILNEIIINIVFFFLGVSPEELFFAFKDQYSGLLTKVNWGLEFNDNIKFQSKKCINGKYYNIIFFFN
jgi:hypothetical protein